MSPEQARGLDLDARTDISVSASCCMKCCRAERRSPVNRRATRSPRFCIKTQPRFPASFRTCPPNWKRIVGKTLRKDREERYQHIRDVLIDLKDCRRELERGEKPERPGASAKDEQPAKGEAQTQTEPQIARTTSSAEYIFGESTAPARRADGFGVLLVAAIGSGYWFLSNRAASTDARSIKSIAVLPLENLRATLRRITSPTA
jgi:hypothetical protein